MEDLLNPPKIKASTIDDACNRIEDFAFVNDPLDTEDRRKAIGILINSLGLTNESLEQLQRRIASITQHQGPMMIGILIGIYIAEDYYAR